MDETPPPLPQAIDEKLEQARRDLLDLSGRNPLLNTRRGGRTRNLNVIDEKADELFRILVAEGKEMGFLDRPEPPQGQADDASDEAAGEADQDMSDGAAGAADVDAAEDGSDAAEDGSDAAEDGAKPDRAEAGGFDADDGPMLAPPDEEDVPAERHIDDLLQTALGPEALQKRLLRTYHDARGAVQETGVGVLYLALGFLHWVDPKSDSRRSAPLVLIPVELRRGGANRRFRLAWTGDDSGTNLTLSLLLKADFRIDLPELPEADDLKPSAYCDAVRQQVRGVEGWEVAADDVTLGFFSFTRFLMYRDLDPESWPGEPLGRHPLVRSLLGEGFAEPEILPDEGQPPAWVDAFVPAAEAVHVMDADSSQTLCVEQVRRGQNLIVQGPPGTGKSQTIANMIAAAVHGGRTVLFVAEKMAALAVVRRRLESVGLGPVCLEIHSNKANKREVLAQLGRTLALGRPQRELGDEVVADLQRTRDELNAHAERLHGPLAPSGWSPFEVWSRLARLHQASGLPKVSLPAATGWSREDIRTREELLADVAALGRPVGVPGASAWRGVGAGGLLPSDRQRLAARWPEVSAVLDGTTAAAVGLAEKVGCDSPVTLAQGRRLVNLAETVARAPKMDRRALADPVWREQRDDVRALVATLGTVADLRKKLEPRLAPGAWDTDLSVHRPALAAWGGSWFGWLFGSYRAAKAALAGVSKGELPQSLADRLALVDDLTLHQQARARVERQDDLGRAAFGTRWKGPDTDKRATAGIVAWADEAFAADLPADFPHLLVEADAKAPLAAAAADVAASLDAAEAAAADAGAALSLDWHTAFGVTDLSQAPLPALRERLTQWARDPEGLDRWTQFRPRFDKLGAVGLDAVAEALWSGDVPFAQALDQYRAAVHEAVLRDAMERRPELAAFAGLTQDGLRERFCELDGRRIDLARLEVAERHHDGVPRSAVGETGVIAHELKKKRRHMPIRQLLAQAGRAVQRIKPVFLMSPLSVAQYLQPRTVAFDVVMMDEASQIRPVDALGAIARGRQVVVVGDEQQMPPTDFFGRQAELEDDDGAVSDLESVLGLCEAQGMPSRMLNWHYRSRHHSLIAPSNALFYDNALNILPAVRGGDDDGPQGIAFHHLPEGRFGRGGSGVNRLEARVVARAVMDHARTRPGRSLGVAAFSLRQRDAVVDELEVLRRAEPEVESFFGEDGEEPFFVKNLENVQGDERDVIFISVGYAPAESDGKLRMNFGPLGRKGGQRRLNVLITRARYRCEVFSAITDEDIDLSRVGGEGPKALKTYLRYARTGRLDGLPERSSEDADESPLVAQLAAALRGQGYAVETNVGVAGLFIDVAVVDDEQPGRYLLGIETDGRWYFQSRSARDRDRTRRAVLTGRGWILERLWSAEWFRRPGEQLARLTDAVENSRRTWRTRDADEARRKAEKDRLAELRRQAAAGADLDLPAPPAPAAQEDGPPIVRAEAAEPALESAVPSRPYVETSGLKPPAGSELTEMTPAALARFAERVVKAEGPIRSEEVARRLMAAWDLGRIGSRIAAAVDAALEYAAGKDRVARFGAWWVLPGHETAAVRNRCEVTQDSLRDADNLPPEETRWALRTLLASAVGVTREEAVKEIAAAYGFRSTGSAVREAIEREINELLLAGEATEHAGTLAGAGDRPRRS